jgi:hypothetical protein
VVNPIISPGVIVPPTNAKNRPLVSVGNGNAVKWGTWPTSTSTSSGGGGSFPVASVNGQVLYWNGSGWAVNTSATAPTTGQVLTWTSSGWTPTTLNTLPSGTASGQIIYWNQSTTSWQVTTFSPGSNLGQFPYWNGSTWVLSNVPSANQVWQWSTSTNSYQGISLILVTGGGASYTVPGGTSTGQWLVWDNGPPGKWTIIAPPGANQFAYGSGSGTGWQSTSTPTSGVKQVLYWNGSSWNPANYYPMPQGTIDGGIPYWSTSAGAWTTSSSYTPSTGQVPVYNGSSAGWGYTTVYSLPTATTGTTGIFLVWSGSSWVPSSSSSLGLGSFVVGTGGSGSGFTGTTTPSTNGQFLYWNTSAWSLTTPVTGRVPQWNGSSYSWAVIPSSGVAGVDSGRIVLNTSSTVANNGTIILGNNSDSWTDSVTQTWFTGNMTYQATGSNAGLWAQTAGYYHVTGQVFVNSGNTGNVYVSVNYGGANYATSSTYASGTPLFGAYINVSAYIQITNSQISAGTSYIQLQVFNVSGGSISIASGTGSTWLAANLVSQ